MRECIKPLVEAGIHYEDALALRRASMTLNRWFELECGDSRGQYAWAIERDEKTEKPYMVTHDYSGPITKVHRTLVADRENGARKRIAKIMARYHGFDYYIQTDPRGCALYVLRPSDILPNANIDSYYNRGIAVYK